MKLAAREMSNPDLPAEKERVTELNTAVFTGDILNTKVLFSKQGRGAGGPSEGGSFF